MKVHLTSSTPNIDDLLSLLLHSNYLKNLVSKNHIWFIAVLRNAQLTCDNAVAKSDSLYLHIVIKQIYVILQQEVVYKNNLNQQNIELIISISRNDIEQFEPQ